MKKWMAVKNFYFAELEREAIENRGDASHFAQIKKGEFIYESENIRRLLIKGRFVTMQVNPSWKERCIVVEILPENELGEIGNVNDLGYFQTVEKLQQAHPEGKPGQYAVIGDTDTIWVWDTDSLSWVNSGIQGSVTSVNDKTGDVTLIGEDIHFDSGNFSGNLSSSVNNVQKLADAVDQLETSINPLEEEEDLIVGGENGEQLRLPKGEEKKALVIKDGKVTWSHVEIVDAGDLI